MTEAILERSEKLDGTIVDTVRLAVEGSYITPGPIFWAPYRTKHLSGCPSGDFGPCDCPPLAAPAR